MNNVNVILELLKVFVLALVEGVTEWLPVSSTGHLLLVDEFIQLDVSSAFKSVFMVVIQLGAIMAVVVYYLPKLLPVSRINGNLKWDKSTFKLWLKIVVASIPAGVVGVFFDDWLEAKFYNYYTIGIMLILFAVLFLLVENPRRARKVKYMTVEQITYKAALIIGFWQLIAAAFPGTSRSGATIVGALFLGISRVAATEFTFFMAIPAMVGAGLLKLIKFKAAFSTWELLLLVEGCLLAFAISLVVINLFLSYVKKHDFRFFAYYRLILGISVLLYFSLN